MTAIKKKWRPKKDTLFEFASGLVAALLLVVTMHTGGTYLGRSILEMQKNYRTQLFNQAVQEQGMVVKMVADEQIRGAASKYIAALADAVIRFEFFPRTDDATIFLEIVSVLPPGVEIDKFAFTGHNLLISCGAPSQEDLAAFSAALGGLENFRSASLEAYQKKDGSYSGTITCVAA